jgi:membrane fusion protein (multidrug efflux system)
MLQFPIFVLMTSLALGNIPVALAADLPARATAPLRPAVAYPSPPLRPMASVQSGNAGKQLGDEMECMLEPHLVANVGSPVEGTLSQVLVDRGAQVAKGQVVARLNSTVEAANLELRKAQEEFGRRKVERNIELFRKELISVSEKDEIETQTRIAELEVKQQQQVLDQRAIRSPLEGVVVERYLAPGERVANEKILRIAQVNPLNVEVVAPVELFGSIKPGMAADINLNPLLTGTYKAKVVVVDRVIDAASGTFGIRLELPNPGNRVPAGIKCRLRFNPR